MKKLLVLLAGLTLSSIYASPVLSPDTASMDRKGLFFCDDDCRWFSVRGGFRGDYVFDRHLSQNGPDPVNVNRYSIFANEGVVTLNFWDRLDIYGLVGAASQSIRASDSKNTGGQIAPIVSTPQYHYLNFSTGTIWGIGARATILEHNFGCCGTSYLGADINYESIGSRKNSIDLENGVPATTVNDNVSLQSYQEMQVSVQLGHKIARLTPYIAAKWSNAHLGVNTNNNWQKGNKNEGFSNKNRHWGYAVGVSLVDVARMTVTAEARFVDESAMTITGEFRF